MVSIRMLAAIILSVLTGNNLSAMLSANVAKLATRRKLLAATGVVGVSLLTAYYLQQEEEPVLLWGPCDKKRRDLLLAVEHGNNDNLYRMLKDVGIRPHMFHAFHCAYDQGNEAAMYAFLNDPYFISRLEQDYECIVWILPALAHRGYTRCLAVFFDNERIMSQVDHELAVVTLQSIITNKNVVLTQTFLKNKYIEEILIVQDMNKALLFSMGADKKWLETAFQENKS